MLFRQAVHQQFLTVFEKLRGLVAIFPVLFVCCLFQTTVLGADEESDLAEQRKQYVSAKKSLNAGHLKTFRRKAEALVDYPLYPYLQYHYLAKRLWKVKSEELVSFLEQYGDLPTASDLRRRWLKLLAKRRHWNTYIENYLPQTDRELQCYHLIARIKTKKENYLLEDIRSTWLSGESMPPVCDPAFKLLYKSELMTDELVWQRIRLAMAEGQTGLASFLSRKIKGEKRAWAERWIAMHQNPSKHTHKTKYEDNAVAREILLHGMHRLLRQNIGRALGRWEDLAPRYSFSEEEVSELEYQLAMRAARKKHKKASLLLDNIDGSRIDEQALHLRLRTALAEKDWAQIVKWTEIEPAVEDIRLRWYYWRARALEKTGNKSAATKIYEWLSKERDYYGFLAADHLGRSYNMNHSPLPDDPEEWQKLSGLAAIQRAREFYLLGSHYSARREWHHALNQMTSYQKQIAASIAASWGWHDRAILTLAKARIYDDLVTRFPMPYDKSMQQFSKMRNLDIAWIYALTRAESAFIEDVRSPAGALGLMQIMPATGKITAKRIGLRNYDTKRLLEENVNVRLGSAYLKHMYDAFNKNAVLATAAYNAGPTNVKRWLPRKGCEEADVWIEQIPFTETRKYVRRILYFASVYEWRMERPITPISDRVSLIQPNKQIVASLSCPMEKV